MRKLDGITDSMDMSLRNLREIVKDMGSQSWTRLSNWTTTEIWKHRVEFRYSSIQSFSNVTSFFSIWVGSILTHGCLGTLRFISSLIQVSGSESVLPANPNIQRLNALSLDWLNWITCPFLNQSLKPTGMDYTDWSNLGHTFHSWCPGSIFPKPHRSTVKETWYSPN